MYRYEAKTKAYFEAASNKMPLTTTSKNYEALKHSFLYIKLNKNFFVCFLLQLVCFEVYLAAKAGPQNSFTTGCSNKK